MAPCTHPVEAVLGCYIGRVADDGIEARTPGAIRRAQDAGTARAGEDFRKGGAPVEVRLVRMFGSERVGADQVRVQQMRYAIGESRAGPDAEASDLDSHRVEVHSENAFGSKPGTQFVACLADKEVYRGAEEVAAAAGRIEDPETGLGLAARGASFDRLRMLRDAGLIHILRSAGSVLTGMLRGAGCLCAE